MGDKPKPELKGPLSFRNIFGHICHYLFSTLLFAQPVLVAQQLPGPVRVPRLEALGPKDLRIIADNKRVEGPRYYLRGNVSLETVDFLIRADEIDYNDETQLAEARGHVKFVSYERGEELFCERAEYNLEEQTGKFYEIRGSSPASVDPRPGLLLTSNPFTFEGKWAERLKDRYILYDGVITNCRFPNPWWTLRGPKFDIIPGDRAIAHKTTFRLKRLPLFYTPWFFKSLEEQPRQSGFLMPNIGNSSRRGKMLGVGYYWAFHRSYDVTYRTQLFTQRGFAHHVDFRGKPTQKSEFNYILYGVNDRGLAIPGSKERIKQGGYMMSFDGKAELPLGFQGRAEVNYLNSFVFRQAFTESFNEAVTSQVHSIGYATRNWSIHTLSFVFERNENYQSTNEGDRITIRRIPSAEYSTRDYRLFRKFPVWGSLESSFGLVRRNQPLFQTRQFVDRADFAPRVSTALRWKEFSLLPSFSIRETHYGSSFRNGAVSGDGVLRSTRDFAVELVMPSLARIFNGPSWLGEKVKHVIEPRAGFRWISGVDDFSRFIRFDETELLTNTKELDFSITNRLYAKKRGAVREVLSWQLWMKRYLDPSLGGAVVPGTRNVFLTQTSMTGYAFFFAPREWSPVVSSLRLIPLPTFGVEWRSDYDTKLSRVSNSSLVANFRYDKYTIMAGHNHVRSIPTLSPSANQFMGMLGWGRQDLRGWSAGFQAVYDFRTSVMQFATTQVSYNSDCCGLSVQYRRFGFGTRNENQFRVAFAVSNIGSFGTLRRQERIF